MYESNTLQSNKEVDLYFYSVSMHVMNNTCQFKSHFISGLFEYVRPAWQSVFRFTPPTFAKFGAAYGASRPSITPATPQVIRVCYVTLVSLYRRTG